MSFLRALHLSKLQSLLIIGLFGSMLSQNVPQKSAPIVIIGAGASGMAAAHRLWSNGFTSIRILEAMNRTGGRVFSQIMGSNEWIELGAQWIHGEGHEVYKFAKNAGLVLDKSGPSGEDSATGDYFLDSGRTVKSAEEKIVERVQNYFWAKDGSNFCKGLTAEQRSNGNMGDYYRSQLEIYLGKQTTPASNDLRRTSFDLFLRGILADNGCKYLKDLSLKSCEYEMAGDELVRLNIPYSQFLDRLTTGLPRSWISLNKAAKRITFTSSRPNTPVTVECEDGEIINAAHVIVTASLGVLKSSPNLFSPPLSAKKQAAIRTQGFGAITKTYLFYDTPFWENLEEGWNSDGFQMLWASDNGNTPKFINDSTMNVPWYRWITNIDPVRTTKNVLVMWLAGAAAPVLEGLSDDQIARDVQRLLIKFTGLQTIPLSRRILREKWDSNQRTRGTYSFFSVDAAKSGNSFEDLAKPEWPVQVNGKPGFALMFAGEATHSTYFSTVHGAVISGWREGDRLTQLYS